jgi:hypothetical protein
MLLPRDLSADCFAEVDSPANLTPDDRRRAQRSAPPPRGEPQPNLRLAMALFAPDGLDSFPMAHEQLAASARIPCTIERYEIVAHRSASHVVAAFGACDETTLHAIAAAFERSP